MLGNYQEWHRTMLSLPIKSLMGHAICLAKVNAWPLPHFRGPLKFNILGHAKGLSDDSSVLIDDFPSRKSGMGPLRN